MVELALETSSRTPSVAVRVGERLLRADLSPTGSHASDLLPQLASLLAELGCEPRDIEAVFVGTGPGSYTGLRVGIATALGLARGAGATLFGVPSGETLAYARLAVGEECAYLLDARQSELYFAHYARVADGVRLVHAPCITTAAELERLLPPTLAILGDENCARAALLTDSELSRVEAGVVPDAAALLELGALQLAARGPVPPESVEPLYLRPFAAKVRKR